MKNIKILFCCFILLSLSACSFVHKPEIIQGNIITPEMISHLHRGMTESEVKEVMGNPVAVNVFTPSYMEYIYTYQLGRLHNEKRVTLTFERGRLNGIYQHEK
jgi:outer membrane protein assembly factor BamE